MKPIDTPPVHPERWPYVKCDDEQCGWLRIPTPGEMQDALAAVSEQNLQPAAKVEAQLGAVVGLAWRSHTHALEETEPRAVYRELHDAGWKVERIAALASVVTDAMKAVVTTDEQIEEARDF